jgi:methionyl-tRNA formyltransferase
VISSVFLGTPAASIPTLQAVASLTDLRLIVTRPDKPRGRSGRPSPSPVKEAATDLGLPVAEPAGRAELEEVLTEAAPFDLGVVVAFGMILRPAALSVPSRGFVNVHFSLLPRWRGAAPVERAILSGDEKTGVTLMVMEEGLDTGPVVAAQTIQIDPTETAGELTARLADLGADLLSRHLMDFVRGEVIPVPQAASGATYADRITTHEAELSATWPSSALLRAVRAYSPRPGARFGQGALKVWRAGQTDLDQQPPGRLLSRDGRPSDRTHRGAGSGGQAHGRSCVGAWPAERSRAAPLKPGVAARAAARTIVSRVLRSGAYSNRVVRSETRKLPIRDAALAQRLAYDTIRNLLRVDRTIQTVSTRPLNKIQDEVLDTLRVGVNEVLFARTTNHAAVDSTVCNRVLQCHSANGDQGRRATFAR